MHWCIDLCVGLDDCWCVEGCRGVSITDSDVVQLGTYHVEITLSFFVFFSIGANGTFDFWIFLEIVNCDFA